MPKKIITNICAGFSVITFCYIVIILAVIMYFNAPNSYHHEDKKFIIESGMTFRQVVEKLNKEKIVKNPDTFLYISQLIKGIDPKVRYGEYFFERNISYYKILHKMLRGNIFFRKVTAAEGLSTNSIIKIIDNSPGLIGQLPNNIKEGTLLPETYFYSYNDTKMSIVKRMSDSMNKALSELWEKRDLSIPLKTKEQALILASIVEKETGIDSERPKVASVFVNRLRKGMKLQSDPTIIYSYAFGNKALERPIRLSDIRNNSNYNTYNIYGLPPTPICNPGVAAIKAVLNPPPSDYLYFVATAKGEHHFSNNINEHNEYVARYRSLNQNNQTKTDSQQTQNPIPKPAPSTAQ
ncbi:MAG: endolytic transglycosylase MltG [Rickettsiales bacterium]|nr:endolytic transglycosylase MltG [Rickettsiales bacterium]